MLTEKMWKMCLPFFRGDSTLSDEIGKLMVLNEIRGPFPLDGLKILRT